MKPNAFLLQLQAWLSGPFILMVAMFLMIAPFVVSMIVNLGRRSPVVKGAHERNRAVHPLPRRTSLEAELPVRNRRVAL